jgi:hypothetical protein
MVGLSVVGRNARVVVGEQTICRRICAQKQGCQMVYFQYQKSQFGYVLDHYGMQNVGIFIVIFDYFRAILYILWSSGIFPTVLVSCTAKNLATLTKNAKNLATLTKTAKNLATLTKTAKNLATLPKNPQKSTEVSS